MGAVPADTYRAAVRCLVGFDERANLARISRSRAVPRRREGPQRPGAGGGAHGRQDPRRPLRVPPGVGHLPNLEAPAAFDAAILDFLRRGPVAPMTARDPDAARRRRADLRSGRVPARPRRSRADRKRAPLRRPRAGAARRPARPRRHVSDRDLPRHASAKACSPSACPRRTAALGASYRTYCLAAAELGRYCGATALSWNMHVCSTLWTGALADDLR